MTVARLPFVTRRRAVSSGGSPGCAASATPVDNPDTITSDAARTRIALSRVFRTEELLRLEMGDRWFQGVEAAGLVQLSGHRADRIDHYQGNGGRRAGAANAECLQLGNIREASAHPTDIDRRIYGAHEPTGGVRIAQCDRVEAVGAGREIDTGARHRLVKAALLVADILQIKIGAGIDDDRDAGGARRLARGADAGDHVLDRAEWRRAAAHTVLEVHAHRAGTDNVADRARDRLRRVAIAGLDIGGDRHRDGSGDAAGRW